jgi:hypothetical protein
MKAVNLWEMNKVERNEEFYITKWIKSQEIKTAILF